MLPKNTMQLFLGAARKGDLHTVQELCQQFPSIDVNSDDPIVRDGYTALMRAASCGKLDVVIFLIEIKGARIDIVHQETGNTPIMFAAEKNQSRVVEYLLTKGANVDHRNREGKTALMLAMDRRINCGDVIKVIENFVHGPRQYSFPTPSYMSSSPHSSSGGIHPPPPPFSTGQGWNGYQAQGTYNPQSGAQYQYQHPQTQPIPPSTPSSRSSHSSAAFPNLMQQFIGAARKGSLVEVKDFFDNYAAEVDACDPLTRDGYTALMRAASAGKLDVVKFLIDEAQATIDLVHPTLGNTALLFAAEKNQHSVVEYLLRAGANIHHRNKEGKTAYQLALDRKINCGDVLRVLDAHSYGLHPPSQTINVVQGDPTSVKYFPAPSKATSISIVPTVSSVSNIMQQFVGASRRGNIEEMQRLFPSIPSVDETDPISKDGYTALMRAAQAGKLDAVKYLIESTGANVDVVNTQTGNTALLYAVDKNHSTVVEYLLQKGANIQHSNKDGETAISIASAKDSNGNATRLVLSSYLGAPINPQVAKEASSVTSLKPTNVIHSACSNSTGESTSTLSTPNKPSMFISSPSTTPLVQASSSSVVYRTPLQSVREDSADVPSKMILAARNGDMHLFTELMTAGGDVDNLDKGVSALIAAVEENQFEMVKYLIEQCAATVDLMDTATGNTALLVAASKNNVTILQYLISMGAKTNHVNMAGKNVLKIAIENNAYNCCEVLQNYFPNEVVSNVEVTTAADSGGVITREEPPHRPPSPNPSLLSNLPSNRPPAPAPISSASASILPPSPPEHPQSSSLKSDLLSPFIKTVTYNASPRPVTHLPGNKPTKTLLQAIVDRDVLCVRQLIDSGADVNAQDENGKSLLSIALDQDEPSFDIIHCLLQADLLKLLPQLDDILFIAGQRKFVDIIPLIKARAFDELHPFMSGIPTAYSLQVDSREHVKLLLANCLGNISVFEEIQGFLHEVVSLVYQNDISPVNDFISNYEKDIKFIWMLVGTPVDANGKKLFDALYETKQLHLIHKLIGICGCSIETLTIADKQRYWKLSNDLQEKESIEFWTKELTSNDV